jgi:hypothetical protein
MTGIEAYVYLYLLVLMGTTCRQMTNLAAATKPGFAPGGEFAHVREFSLGDSRAASEVRYSLLRRVARFDRGADDRFASRTDGRYYLMPLCDMLKAI